METLSFIFLSYFHFKPNKNDSARYLIHVIYNKLKGNELPKYLLKGGEIMKFGILLIRLMLGIIFMVHGGQKVLGGFSEPMAMMDGLGFPAFFGIVLGLFELIGGILLFFGILTNYIASGFIIIMLGALFTVHLKEGYMASEFVLTLLVMSISMIVSYNWKKFVQFY